MESNSLCGVKLPFSNVGCDLNHTNKIQTIEVESTMDIKVMIEESKRTGQPIIIDAGNISLASAIYMACKKPFPAPIVNSDVPNIREVSLLKNFDDVPVVTKPVVEIEKEKEGDFHLKQLDASGISADTKKLIASEYMRLRRLHPGWKVLKAMRKAGEKYNVKFEFE
jgi:hypothetical protein